MAPSPKKTCPSLSGLVEGVEIPPSTSSLPTTATSINLAKATRKLIKSTFRLGNGSVHLRSLRGLEASFTIAMDEAYDYNILGDVDPDDIFPEVIDFSNQLSEMIHAGLTSQ